MVIFKTPLGSSVEYTSSRMKTDRGRAGRATRRSLYAFGAIGLFTTAQANEGMVFVTIKPLRGARHQPA